MSDGIDQYLADLARAAHHEYSQSLLPSIEDYLRTFQPEQFVVEDTNNLHQLLDAVTRHVAGRACIDLLYSAVSRYPRNSLTPVHAVLVRQCCSSRDYASALPLFTQPIESLPKNHNLTYHDHMLYHFYAAICCAALQNWSRAMLYLSLVLCLGGQNTSLIQLEAYRKYILIGLVLHGKVVALPKTINSNSRRALEILAPEYIEIAESYPQAGDRLSKIVALHRESVTKHGNGGLMNTALAKLPTHKIVKLRKIYSSLPISNLSNKLGISTEQTTELLESVAFSGRTTVNLTSEGIVEFLDRRLSADDQILELSRAVKTIDDLGHRMAVLQKQLELDPDYIGKRIGQGGGGGSTGRPDSRGKQKGRAHRDILTVDSNGVMTEDSDDGI